RPNRRSGVAERHLKGSMGLSVQASLHHAQASPAIVPWAEADEYHHAVAPRLLSVAYYGSGRGGWTTNSTVRTPCTQKVRVSFRASAGTWRPRICNCDAESRSRRYRF